MSYNSETVANTFIQRALKEGRSDMSPMKIQKLMWFLNGWNLAIRGVPASNASFQAWKFGPVIENLYHQLKLYGGGPVTSYVLEPESATGELKAFVVSDADKPFQEVVDLTWDKYVGFSATQLSAMTHVAGSPWSEALAQGKKVIDNDSIRKYFVDLARVPAAPRF